eukprot:gene8139-8333_t
MSHIKVIHRADELPSLPHNTQDLTIQGVDMKSLPIPLQHLTQLVTLTISRPDSPGPVRVRVIAVTAGFNRAADRLDNPGPVMVQVIAVTARFNRAADRPDSPGPVRSQAQKKVVHKLATEQDVMLTTLERLSWLVLLLATATFIAVLQPPGGFNVVSHQDYALFWCFVFDGLSFSLSLGCVMMIVALSMPRIQCQDDDYEAGRLWWLLFATWGLFYPAVVCGFAAFTASGLAMFDKWGFFKDIFPGGMALRKGLPWSGKGDRLREPDPELGQS